MSNYLVKVTPGANGAAATATVESRTAVQAIGDTLKAKLTDDTASVGYVSTMVDVGLVYGMGVFAKYRATGRLDYNPF